MSDCPQEQRFYIITDGHRQKIQSVLADNLCPIEASPMML